MDDALVTWQRVRAGIPWTELGTFGLGPVQAERDGVEDFVAAQADRPRARRLLAALASVRDAVSRGEELSFPLVAAWQAIVLGIPQGGWRTGSAHAKAGRERYGLSPRTAGEFDACLADAADPGVPPAARAARVYLDVSFFHPFPDGNARAAMLALYFTLLRDQVVLDDVDGLLVLPRWADDGDGARDLVRLIDILATATRRRAARVELHG